MIKLRTPYTEQNLKCLITNGGPNLLQISRRVQFGRYDEMNQIRDPSYFD